MYTLPVDFWWFQFSVVSHVFCTFRQFLELSPSAHLLTSSWVDCSIFLLPVPRVTQELLTRALATQKSRDTCGTADQSLGNSPNSCSTCTPSSPHLTSALPQNDITMGKNWLLVSLCILSTEVCKYTLATGDCYREMQFRKAAVHVHICTSPPWQSVYRNHFCVQWKPTCLDW